MNITTVKDRRISPGYLLRQLINCHINRFCRRLSSSSFTDHSSSVFLFLISFHCIIKISSAQLFSGVRLFATPWLQHARLPCPSPTPRAYSNSCPLSLWCHPTISSSVVPSSSCLNLSQHQGLFQWVSSSHQVAKSAGVSASASDLPMYVQDWFTLGLTGWILQSNGLSSLLQHHNSKAQFFGTQLSL